VRVRSVTHVDERFRGGTIQQQLTRTSVVISATALVLAASAFVSYYVLAARRSIARDLAVQAETIGLDSVSALVFSDDRAAKETLSGLRADRNVVAAGIYAADGTLFASYQSLGSGTTALPARISGNVPNAIQFERRTARADHAIVVNGRRVGSVHITYSLDELLADLARFLTITVVVLVGSVLVALLTARRAQRALSGPIANLAAAALAVSRGNDYAVRVKSDHAIGELGMLIDTFNRMLSQIQTRDHELDVAAQRYQVLNEQLERRVSERTAELQVINKELEAFTYSVSHDLRAPLRRIDGFSGMLENKYGQQLTDDGAHFLSRIRDGTQHMGRLIDDLLNLARLGRKEVIQRPTDLSATVQRIVDGLSRETDARVVHWKCAALPVVDCDPALIDIVLTNLLSNAVKYTRPRTEAVIEVGAVETPGAAPIIFVRDNGVGFSMKYADKLFGAFQRLHRADEFEGTGIGLATVQRIVHKHNGRIWVEAELDKGATFYFTVGAGAIGHRPFSEGVVQV
jgi:signal transduction histidine kinase